MLSFACQVSAKSKETVIHTTEGLLSVYIFTRLCVYFIYLHDPNCSVFFSKQAYFTHFIFLAFYGLNLGITCDRVV